MIVFDVDKTLRHTKNDYSHTPFAKKTDSLNSENWVEWQEFVNKNGKPVEKIVELYRSFYCDNLMAIVTSSQFGTLDWLTKNEIAIPDVLVERKPGNNLKPFEFKKNFIDTNREKITLWVDDDVKTCDYAESLKIPVIRVTEVFYD